MQQSIFRHFSRVSSSVSVFEGTTSGAPPSGTETRIRMQVRVLRRRRVSRRIFRIVKSFAIISDTRENRLSRSENWSAPKVPFSLSIRNVYVIADVLRRVVPADFPDGRRTCFPFFFLLWKNMYIVRSWKKRRCEFLFT